MLQAQAALMGGRHRSEGGEKPQLGSFGSLPLWDTKGRLPQYGLHIPLPSSCLTHRNRVIAQDRNTRTQDPQDLGSEG